MPSKGHHDDVAKYAATANDAWKHYLFNASSRFLSVVNWLSAEDVEERSPFDVDGMLKHLLTHPDSSLAVECFEVVALGGYHLDLPSACVVAESHGTDALWRYFEPEMGGAKPMVYDIYYPRNQWNGREFTVLTGSRDETRRLVRVHSGRLDEEQLVAFLNDAPYAFVNMINSCRVAQPYCVEE